MKYNLDDVLRRMIKAEKENKKKVRVKRESPIILRQRTKEKPKKVNQNIMFEGM